MAEQNKYKLDRELTAMMVEDFIFDPLMATRVILGLKLPPHEELRILWMWTHYYTNDDSGFSTGKSFTHAIVSALRSILFPDRRSGVISKTYAQGKLIFANYDRWYHDNPIFRWCVRHAGGKPRIVHGSDAHVVQFRNQSEIRVLPPNFMQDAERMRSERWNDAYCDEWTTYGNFEAFNKTIVGRVTRENPFHDCPIRMNHMHLSSTPQFTHHPAYALIKRINRLIAQGYTEHGRFSCNYRHIPDTEQWKWLVNRKIIFTMETSLPRGVVRSEIDGIWQKDSLSYYSSRAIENVRHDSCPVIMRASETMDIYVAAYDVARGEGRTGKGDDFSLCVWRIPVNGDKPHPVFMIRRNNITADQMGVFIHVANLTFRLQMIMYDPGGGGLFVKDELRKDKVLYSGKEIAVTPILEFGDMSGTIGDFILVPFRRATHQLVSLWGRMQSDSVMVNRMHEAMKGAIENKEVALPGPWSGWETVGSQWDVDAKRDWLNRTAQIEAPDRAKAELDLAVLQLIMVDVRRDSNGVPILDSFGMYKFVSRSKKDSAYSLIYGYICCLLWRHQTGGVGSQARANASNPYAISRRNI